jgi:hypothetical protein
MLRTSKKHFPQKKLEFSENGWIKYEFLMHQKLKKPKHQDVDLEIKF